MHISTAAREMAVELVKQSTPNTDETIDRAANSRRAGIERASFSYKKRRRGFVCVLTSKVFLIQH